MMNETGQTCPDCGGLMLPISIVDKTHVSGGMHHPLQYTVPGAKQGKWSGKFPIAGTVAASMCGGCGRIVLRGVRSDESND